MANDDDPKGFKITGDDDWEHFVVPRVRVKDLLAKSRVTTVKSLPKDAYDPEFDLPEARANFATRHIRNLSQRRRRRDELIAKYREEVVVSLYPGRKPE